MFHMYIARVISATDQSPDVSIYQEGGFPKNFNTVLAID